jgi:hypothetical protein
VGCGDRLSALGIDRSSTRLVTGINRLIRVSFKIDGVQEDFAAVQQLTNAISTAMHALTLLNLAARAAMASNPLLWALLGVSLAAEGLTLYANSAANEPTEWEQYQARSAYT